MTTRQLDLGRCFVAAALLNAVGACDGGEGMPSGPSSGAGAAAAGTRGGTSGTSGMSAGTSGGSSGSAAANGAGAGAGVPGAGASGAAGSSAGGSGGTAGMAGGIDMVDTVPPAVSTFDVSGLSADLAPPSGGDSCLETPFTDVGCLTMSGEYNGEPFDFECVNSSGPIVRTFLPQDSLRVVGCGQEFAGGELYLSVLLGAPLFAAPLPSEFSVLNSPDAEMSSQIAFEHEARALGTHEADGFAMAATHTFEARIAGENWLAGVSDYPSELARGAFAASLTPLPTCMPDADGLGCDTVRLRGTFNVRTVPTITLFEAGELGCIEPPGEGRCAPALQCVIPQGQEFGTCM
jgi:hypothetical protein